MAAIQLEFHIEDDEESDVRLVCMQRQIDALHESMGKVRRRLFSQMADIHEICRCLQKENMKLKDSLRELGAIQDEKVEWVYCQRESLFDLKEACV